MDLPTIDLDELRRQKERNFEERLAFIDFYTAWLQKTDNMTWSRAQKRIIG